MEENRYALALTGFVCPKQSFPAVICKTYWIVMRIILIIKNNTKLLQNMPGLCKKLKNINNIWKFCIKFKNIALKYANNFEKVLQIKHDA